MWPTRLLIWSTFYFLWSISNRSGMYCARSLTKIAAYASSGEQNDYGLFLLFDNLKILLSTVSSFEEAERCNNLSFEDVDQAADRLWTAAETIQLLTTDFGNNEDFTDVASILNLSLIKVRKRTFSCSEDNELLDPLNELHLFALHYTFVPIINKCL